MKERDSSRIGATSTSGTPRQQDRFGLDEADVTLILVLVAAIAGLGSLLAGILAARRSSATALSTSLVGIGVGAAAVGWAPSHPLLLAGFVVYGIALGGVDATMNMQGVRVEGLRRRSMMTGFHACWSIGGIVGAGYAALASRLDVSVAANLTAVALVVLAAALVVRRDLVIASRRVTTTPSPSASTMAASRVSATARLVEPSTRMRGLSDDEADVFRSLLARVAADAPTDHSICSAEPPAC